MQPLSDMPCMKLNFCAIPECFRNWKQAICWNIFFFPDISFIVIIDCYAVYVVYVSSDRLLINPLMTIDYFLKPLISRPQSVKLKSFSNPFPFSQQEDSGKYFQSTQSHVLLCVWLGYKAGVRPPSEICPGRRDSGEWLQATAHHRLLHPKPGAQKDPGEDPVDTVRWQKSGFRREVGHQNELGTISLSCRSQTSPCGRVNVLLQRTSRGH